MLFADSPDRSPVFLSVTPNLRARGVDLPVARRDPTGPRAVRLAWTPAIPGTYAPVSAYAIYRSDDGGSTTQLVGTVWTTGPPATDCAGNALPPHLFVDCSIPAYGKRYVYIIRPVDAQGQLGDAYPVAIIDVVQPTNRTSISRNAFRPGRGESANVIYQVTEPGRVRVTVMTQTGEVVKRLLDAEVRGAYTTDIPFNSRDQGLAPLVWDGTNDRGEVVASGAYFVVLEIGKSRDFRAVAVIR